MPTLQSINPYTEEKNSQEFILLNENEIDSVIDVSHRAFLEWKKVSTNEKKQLFLKLADILENEADDCARLQTIEMGMLYSASKKGILGTVGLIRWFANNFEDVLAEQIYEKEGTKVTQVYDPLGVIFGIAPWNFPFNQVLRAAVPNILAGNTQIYKHASNVPGCAAKIEELFLKAGFPKGVYTNIFVSSSMSEHIIANKYVVGVNLTGSEGAGSSVGGLAGKYIKPSVLELGGNDAFIVCDTNNLDDVVGLAVEGRMRNGGQTCTCSKRFIVLEKYYDEFCEKYKVKMETLIPGDPLDEQITVQPLSSFSALEEVELQVKRAVQSGAKLLTGGKRVDRKGYFMTPTILTDVTPEVSSFHEEIFGPVASVIKSRDLEESIKLANMSDFGLAAVVVGDDEEQCKAVGKKLEAGMVYINSISASKAAFPFGGVKKSGYGKENGPDGLKAFTNKKVVLY